MTQASKHQAMKLAVFDRLLLMLLTSALVFGGCGLARVSEKLKNVEAAGRRMEVLGNKLRDDVDKMISVVLTIIYGDDDNDGVYILLDKKTRILGHQIESLRKSIDGLEDSLTDKNSGVGHRLDALREAFGSLENKLSELKDLEKALDKFRLTLDKSPLFGGGK